ncbi:hypothetical protein SteCoe_21801 [Stentor coeruleus]|uniref:Uncharacterized protein n=1 Tax=Stentor coeruleus TaxID=5963 RepID=A0A1R2BPB6_9CILI|nr:hypothetical protein SteCoe_21801 [Stentor coeruleus]
MIYYKYKDTSANYENSTFEFSDGVSVEIESLPFNASSIINLIITSYSSDAEYSNSIEITFTTSGTYENNVLTASDEVITTLSTPTVFLNFPILKNCTGDWACQYYDGSIWTEEGCTVIGEIDGKVKVQISHTSKFRIYDSELVSSSDGSDDKNDGKHYGTVVIIGLLLLILCIGYTIGYLLDRNILKEKIVQAHVHHGSPVEEICENKDISHGFEKVDSPNEKSDIEKKSSLDSTVVIYKPSILKYHLTLGIFYNDPTFPKHDRVLSFILLLACQLTLEGALIGYYAIDEAYVSRSAAAAIVAVVLTLPLHATINLNLRAMLGRKCFIPTIIGFVGFALCLALSVAISAELTVGRHTEWVISFFWGILFEMTVQTVIMTTRYFIARRIK